MRSVETEDDEPKYGNQDTDGSCSLRHHTPMARQIGGSGPASRPRRRRPAPIPAFQDIAFKSEAEFRDIGKSQVQITDLRDIATGKAVCGADVMLPGMKVAVIARAPVVGGKVKSHDAATAVAVPGVGGVHKLAGSIPPAGLAPPGGIAVVASETSAAIQARDKLEIDWDHGPHAGHDSTASTAERVASSLQGAAVIGMTAALHSRIAFEGGAVQTSNFRGLEMVRADGLPQMVHVHMVPHGFGVHATGVGEPDAPTGAADGGPRPEISLAAAVRGPCPS